MKFQSVFALDQTRPDSVAFSQKLHMIQRAHVAMCNNHMALPSPFLEDMVGIGLIIIYVYVSAKYRL
jgi:hypothetical protein